MPQNEDYLSRRHERREAARKKREAEAKRVKRTLFAAVLALVLCGVAFHNLTKDVVKEKPEKLQSQSQEKVPETTVPPTEAPKPTTPAQKDPITTIHIKAAGDLNITNATVSAGLSATGYDFTRSFMDVSHVLSDADITVLNFEGNVCGEPYGGETTSAPKEILVGLRNAGVDMVQTANSRSVQNGFIGLTSTLNAIRDAGLEPMGSYATPEEFQKAKGYTICDVQGVKVAFVAFTKGFLGMGLPTGSENCVNLLYEDYATNYDIVDKARINSILKSIAAEEPDITIAMLHWGSENNDVVSPTQKSIVTLMQKGGVDVILGSHSHTLQHIDYDPLKGTLVAYSLGDFFGDAKRGATNYSIILDMEITKDADTGVTKVTDYTYTPIYTVTENESPDGFRRVVRIEKAVEAYTANYLDKVTSSCKAGMDKALGRIVERLAVPTEVKCPDCRREHELLVNSKKNGLVTSKTCKCGKEFTVGSSIREYE